MSLQYNIVTFNTMFLLFAFLFLLTTFIGFLFTSYLGFTGVFFINFFSIILLWFFFILNINEFFIKNELIKIHAGKWMFLNNSLIVNFDFFIDQLSASFFILTLTISVFVYIYAFSYFRYEPLVERLLLFLNSFILSMLFLVSSGNLIMLFLGWELIGLTSFFLINFWSTRAGTLKAAFKAYSFNKASDFFLLFAIFAISHTMHDVDINTILCNIHNYTFVIMYFAGFKINFIELVSIFLIICAFIKSAQIGLHIWLPDSMEAPVPASSLIHSATLVSAGIFLILRFSPIFELSKIAYYIIPIFGALTAFYGGLCAMFQTDVKRILAYSTISHCGFLMVLCSSKALEYTILYLYVHGFFKAAVFMCVGNVIRFSRNYQDFRKMGGYYKYLPFECLASIVCLFNLAGLPFSFGFYIKHFLFTSLSNNIFLFYFILILCILAAVTGLFYSYRIVYYVFFDVKKGKKALYLTANRNLLKSVYYTNTTLASNFSILSLVVVAYVFITYFFTVYNYKHYTSDVAVYFNNFLIFESFFFNKTLLFYYSYINWFVLLCIMSIILTNWSAKMLRFETINIFANVVVFSLFFFIFIKIL